MKTPAVYAIAVILAVVGGALASTALSPSINPYLTVSEAVGDPANLQKEVQVLATLSSWSTDDAGALHLVVTDGNASLEVTYAGVPPQGLQQGQSIAVIGSLGADRSMNATRLLVKCPSKYE